MRKRRLALPAVAVSLVVAMIGMGLVYAHWSDTLEVQGQVQTGSLQMAWTDNEDTGTDDDGVFQFWEASPEPQPSALYTWPGLSGPSSNDPAEYGYIPGGARYDKDVARCTFFGTGDRLVSVLTAENAYPSYHCTFRSQYRNEGSIPVKSQAIEVWACTGLDCDPVADGIKLALGANGAFVYEDGDGPEAELLIGDRPYMPCGHQIDPQGPDEFNGSIGMFHVLQGAEQNETYRFLTAITYVNWNEWDEEVCEGFLDIDGGDPFPVP